MKETISIGVTAVIPIYSRHRMNIWKPSFPIQNTIHKPSLFCLLSGPLFLTFYSPLQDMYLSLIAQIFFCRICKIVWAMSWTVTAIHNRLLRLAFCITYDLVGFISTSPPSLHVQYSARTDFFSINLKTYRLFIQQYPAFVLPFHYRSVCCGLSGILSYTLSLYSANA